jgi:hypothetical protein
MRRRMRSTWSARSRISAGASVQAPPGERDRHPRRHHLGTELRQRSRHPAPQRHPGQQAEGQQERERDAAAPVGGGSRLWSRVLRGGVPLALTGPLQSRAAATGSRRTALALVDLLARRAFGRVPWSCRSPAWRRRSPHTAAADTRSSRSSRSGESPAACAGSALGPLRRPPRVDDESSPAVGRNHAPVPGRSRLRSVLGASGPAVASTRSCGRGRGWQALVIRITSTRSRHR